MFCLSIEMRASEVLTPHITKFTQLPNKFHTRCVYTNKQKPALCILVEVLWIYMCYKTAVTSGSSFKEGEFYLYLTATRTNFRVGTNLINLLTGSPNLYCRNNNYTDTVSNF